MNAGYDPAAEKAEAGVLVEVAMMQKRRQRLDMVDGNGSNKEGKGKRKKAKMVQGLH